ncbi:MAG: CPBP family intramembrane metalloprotease [Acidobacteria bacterium]|nr:MAG: CPBP family intramembrane metalloprotease [Acidobacteriota bacterium]REK11794.1 MAG: CPBP family intramembrane metalloprotease [Acidobacteriota bacterium]
MDMLEIVLSWLALLASAALAYRVVASRTPGPAASPPAEALGAAAVAPAVAAWRMAARWLCLVVVFWLALLLPLVALLRSRAEAPALDLPEAATPEVAIWQLFWVHLLLGTAALVWWWAREGSSRQALAELGLLAAGPGEGSGAVGTGPQGPHRAVRELGLGVVAGVAGWAAVMVLLAALAAIVLRLLGPEALADELPRATLLLAGLPLGLRIAVAVSAGIFEEIFFRGLLQARLGVLASSALFVLAHAGYGQPLVLVGVTMLSFYFALLRRWRGSVLAAIVAHATFDFVQLVLVLPQAITAEGGAEAVLSTVAGGGG